MEKKLTGLARQDAFLTKLYSQQVHCPACGGKHSLIEARGSSDWSKHITDVKCPVTDKPLTHCEPLFGGQGYFVLTDIREPVARLMTPDEEADWQAFDDNLDWMTDEQATEAAKKIKAKYCQ